MLVFAMLIPMAVTILPAGAVTSGFAYWVPLPQQLLTTSSQSMADDPTLIPTSYTNDTLILKDWQWLDTNTMNVTFNVHNDRATPVTRVQFHVYENTTLNRVQFHVIDAFPPGGLWRVTKLEADSQGWYRLIEFDGDIVANIPGFGDGNFTVTFGANATAVSERFPYRFVVTKVDVIGAVDQYVYWFFDKTPPTVKITNPQNGAHVIGTLLPYCGNNYFTVAWYAYDTSGLWYYSFLLNRTNDNTTWIDVSGPGSKVDTKPILTTDNSTYYWSVTFTTLNFTDPMDGHYTVDVNVSDRVGNVGHDSIEFDYTHPQKPFWLTPSAGFAALETSYNSATGLVESTQVYQSSTGKVLGTTVTAQGYGFAPTLNPLVPIVITITVRLPTYDLFSGSNYEVPVVQVNTDANGNFTTTFIFPKAPKGVYNVTAWSSSTNPAYVTKCAATFTVSEKAIYQPLGDKPEQLIGPDLINVEATGYMKPDVVPETNTIYTLVNNKDALIGVNQQVLYYWYFDGNGTLRNALTYATGRTVANGIFWPSMQPGTYNLTLFLATTGNWWNLTHWTAMTNDEYTNTITVQETLSLLIDIKADTAYIRTGADTINAKLDTLSPVITRIDGNVLTINTTVGMIKATLDQLSPVITRIDAGVATINTRVGSIEASVGELNAIITSVNGYVVNISSTLGPMSTTLSAINTKINSIDWTGLASLTTAIGQINGTVNGANGILTINTAVGLIKPNTDMLPGIKSNTDTIPALSTNVTNIYNMVPDIKSNTDNVPTLTTILYIAVILSLIAMIAAIAGAFLIYRKTA